MKKLFLILGLIILCNNAFTQDIAGKIKGFWFTDDKGAKIKVFKATNGKYYGKIVWLDEPNEENGTPKLDDENPSEKLQTQPIMGLMLIKGFKYDADDAEWNGGTIYDPETGNTYKCNIWFEDGNENILHVKGFIGISLIGREVEWTRTTE